MTKPVMRYIVDWDNDQFPCVDALKTDALNVMHTGKSTDKGLVNLHWWSINKTAISGATVAFAQIETDYGLRVYRVVTGTNTGAGGFFGWDGTSDINVTTGVAYTAVMWIRATAGSGTSMKLDMDNSTASTTFVISGSWQKITLNFTVTGGLSRTAFKIYKNNSATNVTFEATGFMIVAGSSAPNGFNVGETSNLYDVITEDVKSAQWKIGRRKWDATMPDEGTIDLALDNSSRRYSPEYTGSPLFGSVPQRAKIRVDIQTPGGTTWNTLFSGWTRNYEPAPGKTRNKQASIRGDQGRFQLDRIQYNKKLTGDIKTVDQVIYDVILRGYLSGATALQTILNRSKLNACYLVNPATIMSLDTGVSSIPIYGEDWGVSANATKVIEQLMQVEQGFFFIDRSGVVTFYNRDHYRDPALAPSATAISIDTDAINFNYVYGQSYYNAVSLTYRPKSARVDTVWESKPSIVVNARRRIEMDVKFEYPEGKKLTISSVNGFDGGVDDSTYTAMAGTVDESANVGVIFKSENGRGKLTITNSTYKRIRVTVELKGNIVESIGGQIADAVDADGLAGGKIQMTENVRLITEEDPARNLADFLLSMHKDNLGQFTNFTLDNKDDTRLNKIINVKLGSRVTVSEYQTGHSADYAVIGESGQWMPGSLKMTYDLFPLARINKTWIVGRSVLGVDTYLGY